MVRRRYLVVGGSVLALAAAGAGVASATGGDDGEGTISGSSADRASAAALEATGGGTVNAVERDSENGGTFEVEVSKSDGSVVDVRLDGNYDLVGVEGDGEEGGE